jgi:hypothetical protein
VTPGWELSHDADGVPWHPDCWVRAHHTLWTPPTVPLTALVRLRAAQPVGDYVQWRAWYGSLLRLVARLEHDERREADAALTERQRAVRYGAWSRVKLRPRQLVARGTPDFIVAFFTRYWQRRATRRRAAARRASGRSAATD